MVQSAELDESPDEEVHRIIVDSAWERGALFRAEGLRLHAHAFTPTSNGLLVPVSQGTPPDGLWVVTSQTCDIVAPLDKEPYVQACPCAVEEDRAARARLRRSYRGFEIDPETHLVANPTLPLTLSKRSLIHLRPLAWPGTQDLLDKFSKWLGLRVARDAIPDEIDRPVLGPLRNLLDKLRTGGRARRQTYIAFNEAVREVRIWPPHSEDPPFEIHVTLILEKDLSAEEDDAIEAVIDQWRTAVDPSLAVVGPVRKFTPDRVSMEEVDATFLVDLIAESYDGDKPVGARPIRH